MCFNILHSSCLSITFFTLYGELRNTGESPEKIEKTSANGDGLTLVFRSLPALAKLNTVLQI